MTTGSDLEGLLRRIEGNASTMASAARTILEVRAAGEDPDGIGQRAERDIASLYEMIGNDLRELKASR